VSVADHFAVLAAGRRPANDGLLSNCRLEWRGGEAYGEEAILESFRAAPFDPGADAVLVETATSAAWVGAGCALVADLYSGRVGRLWRTGMGASPALEPAVAVAFDPDLRQVRGDVLLRAEDHPSLAPDAVEGVIAAGRDLVAASASQPVHRTRAFVLRAFTGADHSAALFAVHRLTGGATRSGGFAYAAVVLGGPISVDDLPERPWTPRL
jgi:hypothetical protein